MSKDDDEQTVQCTASQQIDDLEKNVAVVGDRSDPGSIESFNIDPEKEKQLLVKLDLFLAPIICLAYLCCFLDRSNIGKVYLSYNCYPVPLTTLYRKCQSCRDARRYPRLLLAVFHGSFDSLRNICLSRNTLVPKSEATHSALRSHRPLHGLVLDHYFHWLRTESRWPLCHASNSGGV